MRNLRRPVSISVGFELIVMPPGRVSPVDAGEALPFLICCIFLVCLGVVYFSS